MNTLRTYILVLFICLLGFTGYSEGLNLPQDDFAYSFIKSPYVHPRILQDLGAMLADTGDQVVAINLLDSQNSNRYSGEIEISEVEGQHPFVICKMGREMFAYQFIGTADNGIHILLTAYSGGGSGTFKQLLLLTLERDMGLSTDMDKGTVQFNRSRLLIRKIGEIGLGDRWKGELKVEGNRLYIGKDVGWFGDRKDFPNAGQRLVGWHDLGDFEEDHRSRKRRPF